MFSINLWTRCFEFTIEIIIYKCGGLLWKEKSPHFNGLYFVESTPPPYIVVLFNTIHDRNMKFIFSYMYFFIC